MSDEKENEGGDDLGMQEAIDSTNGDAKAETPDAALVDRAKALGFDESEAALLASKGLVDKIEALRAPKEQQKSEGDAGRKAEERPSSDPRYEELLAKLRALESRIERVPDAIDDAMLRSGHESLFGKERSPAPSSKEAENRRLVRDAVEVLRSGYAQRGKPVPPDEELVRSAVLMSFPEELTKGRGQTARNGRESQFIARPSPRQEKPPTKGRDLAIASVADIFKKATG